MGAVDVYRVTDKLDDATLDVVAMRLEARGAHPRFLQMMEEYLDAMGIDSARSVLDIGCGTGGAARTIARKAGFARPIIGIDRRPYLGAPAQRPGKEEGLGNRIELRAGDSHTLKLRDGEFDAVVAHTLISHVEVPSVVLREIVRVLAPSGKVGIFDGDYASLTFATDDPAKGKAADEAIIAAVVTNPRVMRQMPQLLRESGLQLVAAFPYILAEVGRADFWEPSIKAWVKLLPKGGAMSESRAAEWARGMLHRSDQGTFFGASNFYGYVAVKR